MNINARELLHDVEKALLMFDHRRLKRENIIKRHFFVQFYALLSGLELGIIVQ